MSRSHRVILVTGLPRSGTTAVGRYLSLSEGASVLHEPMNGQTGLRAISNQFEVPGAGGFDLNDLDQILSGIQTLRLSYKRSTYPRDSWWKKITRWIVGNRPKISYLIAKFWIRTNTIIWKDPLAVFCIDHLAARGVPIVITVRSPQALAASIKRMKWGGSLADLAYRLRSVGRWDQERFPLDKSDRNFSRVENIALVWSATYSYVIEMKIKYPDIILVDVDDVIADPLELYLNLFKRLHLTWSDRVEAVIREEYRPNDLHGVDIPANLKAHDASRNVLAVNEYWKKVLTRDEIACVENITTSTWVKLRALIQSQSAK